MSESKLPTHAGSFDCLRLIASVLVLYSHSYSLLLREADEPLRRLSFGQHGLDEVAVILFFAMSGYLVTLSWSRDPQIWRFLQRRGLRIFPALAAVVLGSVFLLGPVLTTLDAGHYFGSFSTWTYLSKITSFPPQQGLPGVFENNPIPSVINGSLWTLRLEVVMYLVLAALGVLGLLRRRVFALAAAGVLLVLGEVVFRLGTSWGLQLSDYLVNASVFFVGVVLAQSRLPSNIPRAAMQAWLFTLAVAWIVPHSHILFVLGIAPAVVFTAIALSCRMERFGDYSYGIYLWAFPVQQSVLGLVPGLAPGTLFAITLPITLVLAVLSWHLIEQRALSLKPRRQNAATV